MRAFMLRGQGVGVLHDKVFANYPTEAQFRSALAYELERHGVVFERDGSGRVIGGKARERWVRIQVTDLDDGGVDGEDRPLPAEAPTIMRGTLGDDAVAELVKRATEAPPGSAAAAAPTLEFAGTGSVINPDDPRHPRNRDRETLTADDVGTLKL